MARVTARQILAFLAASLFAAAPAVAAPFGYLVDPAGVIFTLDLETDAVVGMRRMPGLRVEAGAPAPASGMSEPRRPGPGTSRDSGAAGRALLTPGADKLLILEPMPDFGRGLLIDEEPSGRLTVYDANTGVALGRAPFFVRGGERLAGVHPGGSKAYLVADAGRDDDMTITIVSLTRFIVLRELIVPRGELCLVQPAK